tara:strand:+ start:137 stop:571 length:435 start_codon:yes stop_codon:yes gene_type:complete
MKYLLNILIFCIFSLGLFPHDEDFMTGLECKFEKNFIGPQFPFKETDISMLINKDKKILITEGVTRNEFNYEVRGTKYYSDYEQEHELFENVLERETFELDRVSLELRHWYTIYVLGQEYRPEQNLISENFSNLYKCKIQEKII